jgi:hypothetical protein
MHMIAPLPSKPGVSVNLFTPSTINQKLSVCARIPGALGAIGHHEVMDLATKLRPLCQSSTTSKLHIIRMGTDCKRNVRRLEVAR